MTERSGDPRVLAAIDGGPVTASVIEVGRSLSEVLGGALDIVHVHCGPSSASLLLGDMPVRVLEGEVLERLVEEATHEDVAAVVVGIRSLRGGGRPAGHVALQLLQSCRCPVAVVPPEISVRGRSARRLLVPVEDDRPASATRAYLLDRFRMSGRSLVAVHVLDRSTAPSFVDRWDDESLWSKEFWHRHAPTIDDVHMETGEVGAQILDTAARCDADMILIEWNQVLDHPRAQVVRDVLVHTPIPLLLIPDNRPGRIPSPWSDGESELNEELGPFPTSRRCP